MAFIGNQILPFDPTLTNDTQTDAERFSGDDSTVIFTLSRSVASVVALEVFVENVRQEPTTAYTVNNYTLTFSEAPPAGTSNIWVVYRDQSGVRPYASVPDGSITHAKLANNIKLFVADNYSANGTGNTYVLSEAPAGANTVYVSIDGIVQRAPENYTVSGTTLILAENPPASSNVHVRHLGYRTTSTVTAIPANTVIPTANLVNPYITGTLNASNISTSYITSSANLHFKVGESQNTAFKIEDTGQLWNSVESSLDGTDYRDTLYQGFMARAWVNFNGTGTVAIRAAGNVSSITDNGTGDYTVNFITAMPDANYSFAASVIIPNLNYARVVGLKNATTPTTSGFRLVTGFGDFSNPYNEDLSWVNISVFR